MLAKLPAKHSAHEHDGDDDGDDGDDDARGSPSAGAGRRGGRRRLFLRRLAERQLLGYALEGWAEAPGRPLPKLPSRLPRTSGGPLSAAECMLIACLIYLGRSAGRMFGHVPFDGGRA